MSFFDFLGQLDYDAPNIARMNLRFQHIVERTGGI
jgi:hypothetical protein